MPGCRQVRPSHAGEADAELDERIAKVKPLG